MKRFTPSQRRFAYAVAGLAGFVDITGFLQLNGYFVSFMTGNTTLLARDLAGGVSRAAVPALLILGFVIGVSIGTLAGDRWAARRKPVVTALVAAMLIVAGGMRAVDLSAFSLALLVMAMGALNTVMSGNRANPVGLTYMTGALVRTGQSLAERIAGDRTANPLPFALLWASLLAGALCGALVGLNLGAASLWVAGGFALVLCAASMRIAPR
ncbi:MAG: DUF1275 family protein [Citromicrobium sp.]|nr:DUF1275 family protein [Citromicrobium sp.]